MDKPLSTRIDRFLAARGVARPGNVAPPTQTPAGPAAAVAAPAPFVCEDDVRTAVREGRTILVNDRTIITPAARDAGEAAKAFVWEGFRS